MEQNLTKIEDYLCHQGQRIERSLDELLPKENDYPSIIHEAMRYSALDGGKRVRPALVLAVCEMLKGDSLDAIVPACAVELVHCYSLVHDDLPALDNDDIRRGKPTSHKKYGEAIALLAGDGLLTIAFHVLAKMTDLQKMQRVLEELSYAAGTFGMIGGQVVDIFSNSESKDTDFPTLDYISTHKTGQLIRSSAHIGAIMGSASPIQEGHITRYGEYLGFAFQVIDDILDGDGYLRFMSAHEARGKAEDLIEKAKKEVTDFENNGRLIQIADLVLNRKK